MAESTYLVTNQTVVQLLAPDHLRGRLTSVLQITMVIQPMGTLLAGTLADAFGAPIVGALLSLSAFTLTVGTLIFSPRMRNMRLSELSGHPA